MYEYLICVSLDGNWVEYDNVSCLSDAIEWAKWWTALHGDMCRISRTLSVDEVYVLIVDNELVVVD